MSLTHDEYKELIALTDQQYGLLNVLPTYKELFTLDKFTRNNYKAFITDLQNSGQLFGVLYIQAHRSKEDGTLTVKYAFQLNPGKIVKVDSNSYTVLRNGKESQGDLSGRLVHLSKLGAVVTHEEDYGNYDYLTIRFYLTY